MTVKKQKEINGLLNKMRNPPVGKTAKNNGSMVLGILQKILRAQGNPVGTRIKALRKENQLTKRELAERMSWDQIKITKIENGFRACSVRDAEQLASQLNSTCQWILGGK